MYIYIYHLVSPFLFSHMHMHLSIYIFIYLFIYTKIHTYVEIHECHVPSLVLHILSSISAIERLLFHRPRSKQVTWGKIMGLHLRVDVASLPHPYYAPWCWYIYLHNWQLGDFVRVNDGKCWQIMEHMGILHNYVQSFPPNTTHTPRNHAGCRGVREHKYVVFSISIRGWNDIYIYVCVCTYT